MLGLLSPFCFFKRAEGCVTWGAKKASNHSGFMAMIDIHMFFLGSIFSWFLANCAEPFLIGEQLFIVLLDHSELTKKVCSAIIGPLVFRLSPVEWIGVRIFCDSQSPVSANLTFRAELAFAYWIKLVEELYLFALSTFLHRRPPSLVFGHPIALQRIRSCMEVMCEEREVI